MFFYPISDSNMNYNFLLVANKGYNLKTYMNDFISSSGGTINKYAGSLFSKIFSAITENVIDLREEYQRYYVKEYDTFELFLYNKYLFTLDLISNLNTMLNEETTLYYGDLTWNVDYNAASLIKEDSRMVKTINSILKRC